MQTTRLFLESRSLTGSVFAYRQEIVELVDMSLQKKPYRNGVMAFIFDQEGRVLISQNADYLQNQWTFPGGGSEKGEEHEETLKRELMEELAMHPGDYTIMMKTKKPIQYDFRYRNDESEEHKYAAIYQGQCKQRFLVEYRGDKDCLVVDKSELRQVKWVEIADLSKYLIFIGQLESTLVTLKEFGKV